MFYRTHRTILVLLALVLPMSLFAADTESKFFAEKIVEGESFFEVKANVHNAIVGKGLVMAHQSNVGQMLNRTGRDIGENKETYKHGVVIEFCSASFSRETTAANPLNILFCPFAIAVFQLSTEPNKVHISYRKTSQMVDPKDTESVKALEKVDNLIAEIVEDAVF